MKRTFVLGCAILIFSCIIYFSFCYKKSDEFAQSKWIANTNLRFDMADDIIDSKMLIGKDTNQVKRMLGDLSGIEKGTYKWNYYMGGEPTGLGVSLHHLLVSFDSNMKVMKVIHTKIYH